MRAAALIALAAAACASSAPAGGGLEGRWRNATAPAQTLQIDGDRASGNGGCNQWGAGVKRGAGSSLEFTGGHSTLMACLEDGVMEREQVFLDAISRTRRHALAPDGALELMDQDGAVLLRLEREGPSP